MDRFCTKGAFRHHSIASCARTVSAVAGVVGAVDRRGGRGHMADIPGRESPSICDLPANERSEDWDCSWLAWVKEHTVYMDKKQRAAAESGMLLALIPPAFLLALGSALVWAVRGFR